MKRLKSLERKGYHVTTVISTGNVVVTKGNFSKIFTSITAAYNYLT